VLTEAIFIITSFEHRRSFNLPGVLVTGPHDRSLRKVIVSERIATPVLLVFALVGELVLRALARHPVRPLLLTSVI
jgi:hypothetical protein